MTLRELIDVLTQLIEDEEATGDEPVIFAHQPSYPLQCGVGGPVILSEDDEDIASIESHLEIADYWEDEAERDDARRELERLKRKRRPVVYLHETSLPDYQMSPYAPSAAFGD